MPLKSLLVLACLFLLLGHAGAQEVVLARESHPHYPRAEAVKNSPATTEMHVEKGIAVQPVKQPVADKPAPASSPVESVPVRKQDSVASSKPSKPEVRHQELLTISAASAALRKQGLAAKPPAPKVNRKPEVAPAPPPSAEAQPEQSTAAAAPPVKKTEPAVTVAAKKPESVAVVTERKPEPTVMIPTKKSEPVVTAAVKKPEPAAGTTVKKPESVATAATKKPEPVAAVTAKKPESVTTAVARKPEATVMTATKKPELAATVASKKPEPVVTVAAKKPEPVATAALKKSETEIRPAEPVKTAAPKAVAAKTASANVPPPGQGPVTSRPSVAQAQTSSIQPANNRFETAFIKLADGFDFPIGKPDAEGYYKARGFRSRGHLGEDWDGVRGGDTDLGDPVYSIADGLVVFAKDCHMGWGNVLIVRHSYREGGVVKNIDALYGHLNNMLVRRGQAVARGQKIAAIGTAHGLYDAHLHLEIRKNLEIGMSRAAFAQDFSNYYDPSQFILTHRHLSSGGGSYRVAMNTFVRDRRINFDKKKNYSHSHHSGGTGESAAALKKALASKR